MKKAKDYIKYKASLLSLNDIEQADICKIILEAQKDAISDTLNKILQLNEPVTPTYLLAIKTEALKQLE